MRVAVLTFIAAAGFSGLCLAQTPETPATRLVAGCATTGAYGNAFGSTGDGMFAPANVAPYRGGTTLLRTPNSRRLHGAETVIELPDNAAATAFIADVETAAMASGRFPTRVEEEDSEIVVLESADGSVRLEISTLGRGAYVSCVSPELQQLAIDEAFGRVRVAERPAPPTLAMPPRPPLDTCSNATARASFVQDFEQALQSPMEYAAALGLYSSTLQQWYGQQLKEKSNFTDEDDAALAMRTLNDPVFGRELTAAMSHLTGFMGDLTSFANARDAGDESLACTHAMATLTRVDEMSASSQRQWTRIEALYREEATRRGVTLD